MNFFKRLQSGKRGFQTFSSSPHHLINFYYRCTDFVRYCEVHRRPYYSNETHNCCKEMFNEKPFFTSLGTCYTTNAVLFERFPFSFSNIKVWLDAQTSQSPGSVKRDLSKKQPMGKKK